MDALSDVLKSVRLEGAVYLNAEFSAPWCVHAKYGLAAVKARLAGDHVILFHYIAEGRCLARVEGSGDVIHAEAGDLLLFPDDDEHLMGSDLRLDPVAADALAAQGQSDGQIMRLHHGGGGNVTRVVCGYLACSRSICRPLFEALPRGLRIPIGEGSLSALVKELVRVGVHESATASPGRDSLLAKVAELMFVEAMRRYVESLPATVRGWLAGVRDRQVGRALAMIHGDPARAWTVEELARGAALSRSALAERFNNLVGESPIQYLSRWRLALAAQALRGGRDSITRIAEQSGYESEASFSRAFKREFGIPPAAWRRAQPA